MNFSKIKTKLTGVIKLSRWRDFLGSNIILVVIGAALSENYSTGTFILIFLANFFMLCFAYMINDVEDSEDDAKDPEKKNRNPISAGLLNKTEGYIVSFSLAFISLVITHFLSFEAFIAMFIAFITGFLYSWKKIRLKSTPLLDYLTHGYFLSGSIFLTSYLAFTSFKLDLIAPFIVFTMFSFGSAIFNQTRDFTVDRETNIKNTASVLGYKFSIILQRIFFNSAIILAIGLIIKYREILNTTILAITLLFITPLLIYIIIIKKSDLAYYDRWLYAISIPGLVASLLI